MTEEVKNPGGAPSMFTRLMGEEICQRISVGESLRHICRDEHLPTKTTVFRWLASDTKDNKDLQWFCDQYALARKLQAECWAEEIIDIADDATNDWMEREGKDGKPLTVLNTEHIQRSRLRIDTRKWAMSKLLPKKYGDSIGLKHQGPDGEPITAININIVEPKKG